MRIISKFHDYYDSVQSVGYDPHLIYHRVQDELRIMADHMHYYGRVGSAGFHMPEGMPKFSDSFLAHISPPTSRTNFMAPSGRLSLIGFAGKYYLVLEESKPHSVEGTYGRDFFYDAESAIKFYAEHYEREVKYGVLKLLGECSINPFADEIEPFRVLNSPVFHIDLRTKYRLYGNDKILTVNPELARMQFYKLFDPFSAYQEIAMFLSGVLGWPENATVQISDKDMRDAKGFDDWSFKKMPTKGLTKR